MNMKQSCKALICAIEGELDGRHCTEEQAAAILDHALPSLTEALARVEAERDTAIVQMQNIRTNRDRLNKQLGDAEFNLCIAHQQLVEAVGLLRYSQEIARLFDDEHTAEVGRFLARHAQAEQQEAQSPMAKIAEGLRQKAADEWANHPSNPANQESQGAQAGDERAAFERKVQDLAERFQPEYRRYGDAGEYKDATLEWAWKLWQARAALATQPAVQDYGYRSVGPTHPYREEC